MDAVNFANVPVDLQSRPAWVLWDSSERDGKPTKLPYQVSGGMAKSNDLTTWSAFDTVCNAYRQGGYAGIGYVFAEDDPFCGIDLDGCRNPESGIVAEWAREIVLKFASYAEVSPSQTGVKIFCRGRLPFPKGRKVEVDTPSVCDKAPAIEVYDRLRYFAVTGWRLKGTPSELRDCQAEIDWLVSKYLPEAPRGESAALPFRSDAAVFERARRYVAKMPAAVSGQKGHNTTFRVACVLMLGFELSESEALAILSDYNRGCVPEWTEKELLHKVRDAAKQPGPRGYLRNAAPERWASVQVPTYREPEPAILKPEPRITTLADAAREYVESLANGGTHLIETGIPDLDYSIGGGMEKGEFVIFAARPSHGKSAVGLQCLHHWTANKMPCAIISEEMSALALGKRTVQFVSDLPQEHWSDLSGTLMDTVNEYDETHSKCVVIEGCGTAEAADEAIRRAVGEHGVQCVVVDYAQLLGAPGRDRYQQMTAMSIRLRQLASSQKILLLALAQMSRAIEQRGEWKPTMADLKETGQLEQDADVIVFLCWPHRLDPSEPVGKYMFFVAKNRNRPINQVAVTCKFDPSRQMIRDAAPDVPKAGAWSSGS